MVREDRGRYDRFAAFETSSCDPDLDCGDGDGDGVSLSMDPSLYYIPTLYWSPSMSKSRQFVRVAAGRSLYWSVSFSCFVLFHNFSIRITVECYKPKIESA